MISGRSWPRLRSVSEIPATVRPGANRAASVTQFARTLVGATMRNGARPGRACRAWQIRARRLQRLAQPHVVGEDAAQPVLPQEGQPAEPVRLVGPQPGRQRRGRRLRLDGAERQQAADLALPRLRLGRDHAERGELVPQPGLEPADPQRAVRAASCSARASSISRWSARSSGFSSEKYAPSASSRCD